MYMQMLIGFVCGMFAMLPIGALIARRHIKALGHTHGRNLRKAYGPKVAKEILTVMCGHCGHGKGE